LSSLLKNSQNIFSSMRTLLKPRLLTGEMDRMEKYTVRLPTAVLIACDGGIASTGDPAESRTLPHHSCSQRSGVIFGKKKFLTD